MITYTAQQIYYNMPFDEYRAMASTHYSFSFLKREINGVSPYFKSTLKVELGKLVDAILTDQSELDIFHPLFNQAHEIAAFIRDRFGAFLYQLQTQISITGIANYQPSPSSSMWQLSVMGRLDYLFPKIGVIDLKVTAEKDVHALIKHMRYEDQVWHYSKLAGEKMGYILIYSTATKKCVLIGPLLTFDGNNFWREKILKFGSV